MKMLAFLSSIVAGIVSYMTVLLPFLAAAIIIYMIKKGRYKKTEYYIQTKNPYGKMRRNKGQQGEFYTYKNLRPLKGYKRFLFNCYLPKEDGETTEVDVILLHESGIYVFESKNYSGWIFGTETQRYWMQTFKNGSKEYFLNPVIQNRGHLKWLRAFLEGNTIPFYSYIVFGDHCILKDITLVSNQHYIVHLCDILNSVRRNAARAERQISAEQIDSLYEKLYPLTQVRKAVKRAHIKNIQKKKQRADLSTNKIRKKMVRINKKRCPCCGGRLVLRTATRGERQGRRFMGCSNYPECRYIKNME